MSDGLCPENAGCNNASVCLCAVIETQREALVAAAYACELLRAQMTGGSDLTMDQVVTNLNAALRQVHEALHG
jgi:hypothetical protein